MDYFNVGQLIDIQTMDGFTPEGYRIFNDVNLRPEKLNDLNEIDINHLNDYFNLIENIEYTDDQNPDDTPVTELLPLNARLNRIRNRIKKLRELEPRLEHLELKGGRHHKKSKRRKTKRRKSKRRKSKRRRNRIHH